MIELEANAQPEKLNRKSVILRRLQKMLWILLPTLFIFLLILALGTFWFVRRPWPQVEGNIKTEGLQHPVEVIRDQWGVPHIFAKTSHDLFFTQGYVHAQDRMWQLEFTRRAGNGRLSEVLGPPTLGFDKRARILGIRRAAERDWEKMQGEDRAALNAYTEGINAYLKANRNNLSLEFTIFRHDPEQWNPIDSLVIIKLLSWILSENATFEISRARIIAKSGEQAAKEILPPYSMGAPIIIPADVANYSWLQKEELVALKSISHIAGNVGASNSWVISGGKTTTGKTILANDTHLNFFMPSTWYANSLHYGEFNTVGYSIAGSPGISIGHNDHIAWGITDLVADVQDFYIEKFDDTKNPKQYEYRGKWTPLNIRNELIKVKGASSVTINVTETIHGPLVHNQLSRFKDSRPLSISWAALHSPTVFESIILLNKARNWDEFRQALSKWDGPNLNFVYADTAGNIGYQAVGLVPNRGSLHHGVIPVPGWTGEFDWQGYVPYEDLPRTFNPSSQYIVTANQKPVSEKYPYRLGYEFADPYRAMRINQLLSEKKQISLDDSKRMQGDTHHLLAESLLPYLLSVPPAGDLEKAALDALKSWDFNSDPDQIGATIYQTWYRFLVEETISDELGAELLSEYLEYYWVHGPVMKTLLNENKSSLFDNLKTKNVETRDMIVRQSFTKAVTWLSSRYGSDPKNWQWGRVHTMRFLHRPFGKVQIPILTDLFNVGPIAAPGGDRFTINATWFTWDDSDHPFAADAGTSQRIIIDLGDWDRSIGVNSTGQSEHLFHQHREDLISMWQNLTYHPLLFSRNAIEARSKNVLKLTPIVTQSLNDTRTQR